MLNTTTSNNNNTSLPLTETPSTTTIISNNDEPTTSSPLKQFLSKLFKRRKSQVGLPLSSSSTSVVEIEYSRQQPHSSSKNQAFKNLLTHNANVSSCSGNGNNNISSVTSHSTSNIINSSTSGRKSKSLSASFFKRRHTTQLSQSPLYSSSSRQEEIESFREEAIKRQIQTNDNNDYNNTMTTIGPSSSVTTITSNGSSNGLSTIPNNNGNTPHPNRARRSSSSKSIPDNADTFFDENSVFDLDDLMWITMEPTTTKTSIRPKATSSNSLISLTSNNANSVSSSNGRRDSAHSSVNDEEIVDDLEVIIPSITVDDGSMSRTLSSPATCSTNNPQPPSLTRHVNGWDLDDDMEAHNSFSFSPGSINASNIINL